jgi:hypothetical protein
MSFPAAHVSVLGARLVGGMPLAVATPLTVQRYLYRFSHQNPRVHIPNEVREFTEKR